ncbi:hypothetical protein MRB53_042288 [Persea americana]|nr:hypothetical protein MRB53_042288 [Persea americana]
MDVRLRCLSGYNLLPQETRGIHARHHTDGSQLKRSVIDFTGTLRMPLEPSICTSIQYSLPGDFWSSTEHDRINSVGTDIGTAEIHTLKCLQGFPQNIDLKQIGCVYRLPTLPDSSILVSPLWRSINARSSSCHHHTLRTFHN